RPKVDPVFLNTIAEIRRATFRETLIFGGVSVLAAFAGGLWTTLLLRQVSAAFWLTFLVPMGLGLVGGKLLSNFPDIVAQTGLCVLFGVYSVAGFLWAKRLFFSAQDVQWTGGVVSLPVWRRSAVLRESAPEQQRMPLRA